MALEENTSCDRAMKLYHDTRSAYLPSILKHGLDTGESALLSRITSTQFG
jgi:hypothetical protein